MLTKQDFKVGQKLYLVPSDKRDKPRYAKIVKIGRKYVTLDSRGELIIDLSEEVWLDKCLYGYKNYGNRGRFYFSAEDYANEMELEKLTKKIIALANNGGIKDISMANSIIKLILAVKTMNASCESDYLE